jgi:glycosyltransferase involved in cell wall biosynthesis
MLRKGIPYLLEAFSKLDHPNKKLLLVGSCSDEMTRFVRKRTEDGTVELAGPVPQARVQDLMSESHVMVLPSIEEGFGMVLGQALACGCPVVASENTGASDLFREGFEGYIVPIRQPDAIADRLQHLADHPEVRDRMSRAAVQRVKSLGGWDEYGANYVAVLEGSNWFQGVSTLDLS